MKAFRALQKFWKSFDEPVSPSSSLGALLPSLNAGSGMDPGMASVSAMIAVQSSAAHFSEDPSKGLHSKKTHAKPR